MSNTVPLKKSFAVKYVENGDICDVGFSGGHMRNHSWAYDQDCDL